MSESQKIALRKLLNHYQDRAVNTQQFRILQGVLTSDFSLMEVKRKARQAKKREIMQLKSDVKGLTAKAIQETTKVFSNANFFDLASNNNLLKKNSFNSCQQPAIGRHLTMASIKERERKSERSFNSSDDDEKSSELSSGSFDNNKVQTPTCDQN